MRKGTLLLAILLAAAVSTTADAAKKKHHHMRAARAAAVSDSVPGWGMSYQNVSAEQRGAFLRDAIFPVGAK